MKQVSMESVLKVNGRETNNGSECLKDMESVPEVYEDTERETRGLVEKVAEVNERMEQITEEIRNMKISEDIQEENGEIVRIRISSDGSEVVDSKNQRPLKVDPVKRANALKGRYKASGAQKASGWGNIHPDTEMRSEGSGGRSEGVLRGNVQCKAQDGDDFVGELLEAGISEDVIRTIKVPKAPAVKSVVADIARGHDQKVTASVLAIVDYYERQLVGKDTTIRNLQRSVGTRRYW